jgi:hypothetical protein
MAMAEQIGGFSRAALSLRRVVNVGFERTSLIDFKEMVIEKVMD